MTSWVLVISKDYPEHWEIAKKHRLWDLRTSKPIKAGDVIYFWLAAASFVGRVEVTEDARPVAASDSFPWRDAASTVYQQRVYFENPVEPIARPKWGEVVEQTGLSKRVDFSPRSEDPAVERMLRSYFESGDPTQSSVDYVLPSEVEARTTLKGLDTLDVDEREVSLAALKLRQGQSGFRTALLSAYEACAVTGMGVQGVLEAAHISPYRGAHTNVVQNGLLLRADIHSLFDLQQLTIEPSDDGGIVRVNPSVQALVYTNLDGESARLPADSTLRPDPRVLRQHNADCAWLTRV